MTVVRVVTLVTVDTVVTVVTVVTEKTSSSKTFFTKKLLSHKKFTKRNSNSGNSKTQIVMKLKNSNSKETQKHNSDEYQNSNCVEILKLKF